MWVMLGSKAWSLMLELGERYPLENSKFWIKPEIYRTNWIHAIQFSPQIKWTKADRSTIEFFPWAAHSPVSPSNHLVNHSVDLLDFQVDDRLYHFLRREQVDHVISLPKQLLVWIWKIISFLKMKKGYNLYHIKSYCGSWLRSWIGPFGFIHQPWSVPSPSNWPTKSLYLWTFLSCLGLN